MNRNVTETTYEERLERHFTKPSETIKRNCNVKKETLE